MRIQFQNENLAAGEGDQICACAPGLVCIVDRETAQSIPV